MAGPIQEGMLQAARVHVNLNSAICSAEAVLRCGYASLPKTIALTLPWGLRRAGAGVALTVFGANVSIHRGGLEVSKSVRF
jgi:hypothetical protein